MHSDHTAILTSFKLTAIKFKVNYKIAVHIDWKLIGYHKLTNNIFNNSLYKSIYGSTTYSNYNKNTPEAGTNTVTINKHKNKGLFHLIRNYLLTLIKERDAMLSDYQTLGIGKEKYSETKTRLKIAQSAVGDTISLAKVAWYAHQAEKIHPMRFNPKEAW